MINRNLKNRDILDVYYKNENDKKEHKYRCYNPETAISPKGYSYLETIHNGSNYVIARIEKDGDVQLVMRWHIAPTEYELNADNDKICLGYPNTRGYPTWFILPDGILGDIHNYMLKKTINKI